MWNSKRESAIQDEARRASSQEGWLVLPDLPGLSEEGQPMLRPRRGLLRKQEREGAVFSTAVEAENRGDIRSFAAAAIRFNRRETKLRVL